MKTHEQENNLTARHLMLTNTFCMASEVNNFAA